MAGRIGIHGKLLIFLTVLVSFIISLVWICQIVLLLRFYQNYRSSQVHSAANLIMANIDHEDLDDLADRISADNEICMLLIDDQYNTILSIDHVRFCVLHHMKQRDIELLVNRMPDDGSELVELSNVFPFRNDHYHAEDFQGAVPLDESTGGRSMLYARRVFFKDESSGILLINAQITPTSTIISMLQRQFLYIIILIITVTIMIGYFMAVSVSQPIIETNRAARSLSRGDYQRPPHYGGYREIAELNDTLVEAAKELKKVDDLQQELIANISHDLRTPLTMIQGYAETMRDIPEEMTPENMQIIIDEAQRLSSLVSEVLEFSRMRTGNFQLHMEKFDLTETVRVICARVSAMTEKDGYRVICIADNPCLVWGDSARIEQVVYNLIGNALTWTGDNKQVILKEDDLGNRVRISIQDSGKGISPEELQYIWNRYYRARENHRRAVIGSGLGLNICKGILEKHNVPYGVESTIGEGTTFWFEMEKA